MATTIPQEGLKSEALRSALTAALAGRPTALEDLLARFGGGHDGRPNLRLCAAFGAEMTAARGQVAPLLARLAADDAAPDDPRVFLPMAAAHGWVGRLRGKHDIDAAWAALGELGGDERVPVRIATLDALRGFAARDGGARALLGAASDWLTLEDRELRYGAAAMVVDVFADRSVTSTVGNGAALMDYLTRAIDEVADAPRSAERSDARRRLLLALPPTLTNVVLTFTAGERGAAWLQAESTRAKHPDLRAALSAAVVRLSTRGEGLSESTAQQLRGALQASAKPPRDPTLIRKGQGRGKVSRRIK